MKATTFLRLLKAGLAITAAFAPGALRLHAVWWENPHDKWYLKDDWKGAAVNRYAPRFKLESPAASGWIVVWGERGVQLTVNGRKVMQHIDRALIYDTDLTPFVKGAQEVQIEAGPGKIVAEGELIDDQGRRYPFAAGCDWKVPVLPGTKLTPAANAYRPGESSGAFHSAHNGLLLRYNEEERGKTEIAKSLGRMQKLRDQSIFLLRRFRPAEDVLSFAPETLWRSAESHAAQPTAEAEKILRNLAIPAQKRGDYTGAITSAQKAGLLLAAAELAVNAARELEEVERQQEHLRACASLMAGAGVTVPPLGRDFELAQNRFAGARREAGFKDWANAAKHAAAARDTLASIGERLAALWGFPVGQLDEFPEDRFGWLNVLSLMGNDPAQWEFSTVHPAANWIDLRGRWDFRIDPPNQGEELGWHRAETSTEGWRAIMVPGPWERQGARESNDFSPWDCPYKLTDLRCEDKPYNGYAWYRHEVLVPKTWSGGKVVLRVEKVSNWLRVFVNGQLVERPRKDGGAFGLPSGLVKPGEHNTIAIQVYNHDNFGGITGGPVSLALDDAQPDVVTTPGPASFASEFAIQTPAGVERLVTFSSAMTPAVVFASDQSTLHFWGWEAKGFAPPKTVLLKTSQGEKEMQLDQEGMSVDGAQLADSWLYLTGGEARNEVGKSRPVFLVTEQRPRAMQWRVNELGFSELTVSFDSSGSRVIVLQLSEGEPEWDAATCSARAQNLRAVPVACSELARLGTDRRPGRFFLQYHYLEIPDFTGQPAARVAPVPMLFSYGLRHQFPELQCDDIVTTSYASQYAAYRLRPSSDRLSYTTPLIDKSKVLQGIGELFAKRRPEDNARGGNTEQQMFDDWKAWGFDHCRYAFAWNQDWDIPLQQRLGGPINDDPQLWERMDDLVKQHADRGLMAMLCYFFNEDAPQKESKNLVRNSTRYWQMHPETRTNCYELWRRIAARYASYPDHLIAYDFFNEPAYVHREDWNQILKDLTRIVRSVDKKHLIVCEAGDGWSQPEWFHWVEPTGDTNTIYSFHHYGKHWGYHYDEYYPGYKATKEKEMSVLLEAILFGIKYDVPMHCGEFGVSMISPGEDHLVWLDDYLALCERFGIGWNWWNWSGSDIYRTGLKAGHEISPNLAVLRKWIERKAWPALHQPNQQSTKKTTESSVSR